MGTFTPRVMRFLSDQLTDTPLREIDALLEDRGVALGPEQLRENDESVRRERMRRYLATLDLGDLADAQRLAAVLGDVLQKITQDSTTGWGNDDGLRDRWLWILREDGFDVDESTGTVRLGRTGVGAQLTERALNALPDPQSIHDHLRRLGDSVDTDPRLAVSTAKALIESTAKCVLTARGQTYSRGAKVPALVNAAQETLGLAPKSVSDEDRALRQALQSLFTPTQSVTELRNSVGIDHGAEEVPKWVRPRHARLVVGAAQVWCQLMLETLADPDAPWRRSES
ncbi:abortive infection family protein [Glutamicibacter sp. MNS18]|uniref:abortive infection family protein n=1 Tax=Glutamicibacter sp. MNS18 TaxID=2989817 RepID=UPI00223612F5|nr:abortive infection family protein [Glutamicibacter sp. MNS18]MCW4464755.1 abortive infection family protein [Glutamicibacter sp. MNS18]